MSEPLKPCPFCGTVPTLETYGSPSTSGSYIECRGCAGIGRVYFEQDGGDCGLHRSPSYAWNNRPLESALLTLLERVVEAWDTFDPDSDQTGLLELIAAIRANPQYRARVAALKEGKP